MRVLGIDCSTGWTGVGLFSEGAVKADVNYLAGRRQASLLPLLTSEVLERSGLEPWSLDAVSVTVGPGSFTGIRVGLSYACALSEGIGRKVVPVSSLMALGAPLLDGSEKILPLVRARRGQVYLAALGGERRSPFFLSPPRILSLEDLASSVELKSGFLTVADDDQALSRELSEMNIRVSNFASVRGGTVALLGGALFGQAVDPGEVRALYIRTPDTGAPSG
ncbi:MAG: tRNA (adenosine(37)-N6)-threonylcarbamoyltransferase complex dimerization subunit type 1 TsaB [Thermovirgaceae bacterium]|jgi:tRNA threonylcarbamoyladenosine biosynthesis protein TsaB|nr:tRNA (adenosine(37)-N6)-threonylcarbamoyltransferase complex dimerization subunit type 1 TsaB [Synergistales bacterium]MDI9392053.1 tRNA (adenosine(37)-N6)-threonylcarbamoyltransferase complex dimerization subunit type 1 TsaB [Synergistota bacterium]MDY0179190.1 tRNA (adenosine(37)-N6)-threonylcarbamoyltransferase complex dimerization subunit type 1 TsaB [Synergistaceae bacterium]HRW87069.1 tRNA (adenosine(37)-N6)-threonylcarbamoyltransferase complex dimerization subunit type 1 TsaB [Thermovi